MVHAFSCVDGFNPLPTTFHGTRGIMMEPLHRSPNLQRTMSIEAQSKLIRRMAAVQGTSSQGGDNLDDDQDEDELEEDPYQALAASEFRDTTEEYASAITRRNADLDETKTDWGGEIGKLRQRVEDVESGLSKDPSQALFRVMSSESPNMLIGEFVKTANPKTVQAMTGAVSSLLGGLATPTSGFDTLVKASGQQIGSLCFQLQMTGYMFRNAEYVLALKDVLNLQGKRSLKDYKDAFDRLDKDNSGFIEVTEIISLFDEVYSGNAPAFETHAFMKFFDENDDGRISWSEFEKGLGATFDEQPEEKLAGSRLLTDQTDDSLDDDDEDDDDDDDEPIELNAEVSGTIDIELDNGIIVEVDAKEYMEALKAEAQILKAELSRAKGEVVSSDNMDGMGPPSVGESTDIAQYINAADGDVSNLTEGISPDVVSTMKKLVEFVLEGGDSGKGRQKLSDREKAEMQMEIPSAALHQLSLWQLVLGYRLREAEAKGDYKKLLKD